MEVMRSSAPSTRPAAVSSRLAAALIDGTLLFGVWLGISTIAVALGSTRRSLGISLAMALSALLYEVVLTSWRGQTVGKHVVGVIVVAGDDTPPNLGRSGLRYLVKSLLPVGWLGQLVGFPALGPLYCIALLASIAVNPYRRGWHDRAAGTIVLEVAERRRATAILAQSVPQVEVVSKLSDP
jgi:uncharacterized RDD family membrane protein YckC